MRLEDLYTNFGRMNPAQQAEFVFTYRQSRNLDLAKPSTFRKKASTTQKTAPLTEKERVLMSLLGLKRKDIMALRESVAEDAADDDKLLTDDSFDFEDEEEANGE